MFQRYGKKKNLQNTNAAFCECVSGNSVRPTQRIISSHLLTFRQPESFCSDPFRRFKSLPCFLGATFNRQLRLSSTSESSRHAGDRRKRAKSAPKGKKRTFESAEMNAVEPSGGRKERRDGQLLKRGINQKDGTR